MQPALYPDTLGAEQLQQARAAGRVTNLGHFDTSTMGCGNFGSVAVDQNLIGPAIQKQLDKMGGNAAENITIGERPENFFSGWLVAPALAGCVAWNVSGDALKVDMIQQGGMQDSLSASLDATDPASAEDAVEACPSRFRDSGLVLMDNVDCSALYA